MSGFVKARGTDTPVANSKRELERVLQRYQAESFGIHEDWANGTAVVNFRVPDVPGNASVHWVKVQLDVRPQLLAVPLFGKPWGDLTANQEEQCKRVAWRQLVLLVDAACCAAALKLRPLSHTFLAEILVTGADGRERHLVEELQTLPGTARLLGRGT